MITCKNILFKSQVITLMKLKQSGMTECVCKNTRYAGSDIHQTKEKEKNNTDIECLKQLIISHFFHFLLIKNKTTR